MASAYWDPTGLGAGITLNQSRPMDMGERKEGEHYFLSLSLELESEDLFTNFLSYIKLRWNQTLLTSSDRFKRGTTLHKPRRFWLFQPLHRTIMIGSSILNVACPPFKNT
ncbi:hypothetical protein M422DRAFT_55541 [Sphaerobolus stellatus SS14]|uniref:Uncharacterized protein n=1 Tax=Sphaerobolus stellatus (strain SS14) TaxID=990650 RepID=A0A0C9ULZ7_SPHS4|nr:hypothetical protein M422DRAFT_55539 [Sphaerobolus stellatus SS14]KIJ26456.1 hypothetical protein M422DRAFT_55541 [Sphaerobolus stellatus SS14]